MATVKVRVKGVPEHRVSEIKQTAKKRRAAKKARTAAFMLLFPVILTYFEIIFKCSTVGNFYSLGTLFTALFSISYGFLCYLLTSIFKSRKINTAIALVLLILNAVVFLIEYFVYREFKIFYDINTVTNGAGHVIGGFMGEILNLITGKRGLICIILFFLPILLYIIFGRKIAPAEKADLKNRVIAAALFVLFLLCGTQFIKLSHLSQKYRAEYTFQDAVSNFGLISAIRLDIGYSVFDKSDDEEFLAVQEEPEKVEAKIEEPETPPVIEPPKPEEPPIPEPVQEEPDIPEVVEYGFNALDIDFEALAENASSKAAALDSYVSSLTPSKKNEYTGIFEGKNLIFITAEAFTAEAIDEELTPTLYRMATKGINFTDYYQPASAGTTGGEYQNLLGMLPTSGGASMQKCIGHNLYYTLGNQLDRLGYYGKAYHNNDYKYYNRNKTHEWLGYSDGFMGYGNGIEEYVTNQWPESDYEMILGTLPTYIDKQPFNIYYMTVSGHNAYSPKYNAMAKKHWSEVEDLDCSTPVKSYLACNIELDRALHTVITMLEAKGIADDTVICISADHFPYGLDNDAPPGNMPYLSELYGYKVTNYMQRDHSRLIIWSGCLEDEEPIIVSSPTFSLDIIPTLSNLFGTEFDSRLLVGRDVFSDAEPLVFNILYDWKTDLGTYISSTGKFTPTDENAEIPEGYVDRIKAIVKNKMKFCEDVLATDYYAHIFGEVE